MCKLNASCEGVMMFIRLAGDGEDGDDDCGEPKKYNGSHRVTCQGGRQPEGGVKAIIK
jgi:hypothetical protein